MTTYKHIAGVKTAISILRHLADQKDPVAGADVSRALNIPVGTVMCHLATLEDDRMVRRIGKHWELGDGMALFWARRKARIESDIVRMKDNLHELGVDTDA